MHLPSKKNKIAFMALAFAVFLAILPLPRQFSGMKGDPDRFYHFRISQIYADQGFPKTLPQAEDVGWGDAFAEKEFLFHELTGLGHKLAGEWGVLWVTWALYAAIAASFGYILGYSVGSLWLIPVGAALMMMGTGIFSLRMLMVRPHVLAILLMTWQMFCWSRGAWIAACFFGAIYTLSYHAFYVPLLIAGVFITCQWAAGHPIKRQALWAVGGILMAVLINPAFPYNIDTAIQHASIVLAKSAHLQVPDSDFGVELRRLTSDEMLKRHGLYLLLPFILLAGILFKGTWRFDQPTTWRPLKHPNIAACIMIAMIFAVLTFLTPRAYEILVPAVLITIATTASVFKHRRRFALGFCLLSAVVMGRHTYSILEPMKTSDLKEPNNEEVGQLLAQIPKGQPAKVFNLNWDMAPYIFYHRPDLKFVDLLDPTFLARKHPDLYDIKQRIQNGQHPDPWLAIRGDFNADYVLSYNSDAIVAFNNPLFERLPNPHQAEQSGTSHFRLYKVKQTRPNRFVTQYQIGLTAVDESAFKLSQSDLSPNLVTLTTSWPAQPKQADPPSNPDPSLQRVFLDMFGAWLEQHPNQSSVLDPQKTTICMRAKPQTDQLQHLMATASKIKYLGIGGGPILAAWNGTQPLFKAPITGDIRTINHLLDVTTLGTKDLMALEFMVCAPPNGNLSGLTVSLWSAQDIESTCRKSQSTTPIKPSPHWAYEIPATETCLGMKILAPKTKDAR